MRRYHARLVETRNALVRQSQKIIDREAVDLTLTREAPVLEEVMPDVMTTYRSYRRQEVRVTNELIKKRQGQRWPTQVVRRISRFRRRSQMRQESKDQRVDVSLLLEGDC